jgi:phosphoglycerate dehydrogenase-like enzyme
MISLLRHTFTMSNNLKQNNWNPIQGKELRSCIIGIVGMGSIGKEVVRRAVTFGSKIRGYGRTWNDEFADKFGVERKSIEEIFIESDIITIHLPFTSETDKLIDNKLISLAKPNALIINTSRAGVIDNKAVAKALELNHLAGAAVDVFMEERDPYPYGSLENVILTPHIGSHTHETRKSMEEMAAESLVIFDSFSANNKDLKISNYIIKHSVT